ncbi:hypothetical protein ABT369_17330 [Dactylosporangium sp. NPDC000244]|uniref:hypothetical protein n=1 Tax=Dactylosporangium sp. NPDC000244 TaxID=3154365 RepID=UPI00331ABB1D
MFPPEMLANVEAHHKLLRENPRQARIVPSHSLDWEGTQPAKLSEEQLAYVEHALRDNADARWTF